jgi:hypothetical protein
MKIKLLFTLLLFSALLLDTSNNTLKAQTIANAGFELWPSTNCPYNVAPTSWTNFSTNLGPDHAGTCAGTVVSYQGNSHMNLVWSSASSLAEGASQIISGLVSGQTYQIGFEAINDLGLYSGTDDVILDFYLDNVVIFSTPTLVYGGAWTACSVNFMATSTSHTIGFKVNAASGSNDGSAGVDAVTINISTLINELFSDNNLDIYPNPTPGQFIIALTTDVAEISIIDILGNQILKTQATQKTTNIQLVNNGVYIVFVKTRQGTTTRKLIVNH